MNFIRAFMLMLVSLTSFLWAKTSYYILPVQLDGVHEDYAEKIVSLTKEYVAIEDDEVVSNKSDCDYLLQIKLIRKEKGVAVIYEKQSPEGEMLWSYGRIAYSPEGFAPVVSYAIQEMDKWENEFVWGFGFGAMGLFAPIRFVDYNYEPFVQFNVESVKLAASLNIAYLGSKPKGVHGSMLGASFSVAYMFGRRFVVPYLGAGMNYALFSTEIKKEVEKQYGVKVKESFSESVHTPGYFLEMGLAMKLGNGYHVMLESRYFRAFDKLKNIHDGTKSIVHGFSVGVKFGV
jgi:hypothetical protein